MMKAKTAAQWSAVRKREYLVKMERLITRRVRRRAKAGASETSVATVDHLDDLMKRLRDAGYEVKPCHPHYRRGKIVGYWGVTVSWAHHVDTKETKEAVRKLRAVG